MDCCGVSPPILPPSIQGTFHVGIHRGQYQEMDQEVVFGNFTQNELSMAHFLAILGHFAHPMLCKIGGRTPYTGKPSGAGLDGPGGLPMVHTTTGLVDAISLPEMVS